MQVMLIPCPVTDDAGWAFGTFLNYSLGFRPNSVHRSSVHFKELNPIGTFMSSFQSFSQQNSTPVETFPLEALFFLAS